MNITPLTIYLWQLADKAQHSTLVIATLAGIICGICMLRSFVTSHEKNSNTSAVAGGVAKKACIFAIVSLVVSTLIPSSSTIAMMIVIPEIAHSKVIQQDVPDIYNAAVEALKNQLKK